MPNKVISDKQDRNYQGLEGPGTGIPELLLKKCQERRKLLLSALQGAL